MFVYDEPRILVQEKVETKYVGGLVFLGGYVEEGESLRDSVIREVKVIIKNPHPCSFKDWIQEAGSRYIIVLYKNSEYEGEISSSREGRVSWLKRKDIPEANFIWNMRELLEIFEIGKYSGFFFKVEDGKSSNRENLIG